MKESLRVSAGKHRFVRHCILILLFMGLFVQCQRTETEPQIPKIIDDHEAIDQAKKWFDANMSFNAAGGRQVISKKTVWERAFTVRGQVVVPLVYDDTLSARRGYNRLFLTPDKDGKYKSKIIRFVPLGDYLEKNGFKIREEDFTGLVFAYGWDESFTGGWLSSGGKITGTVGDREASPSGRTQTCVTYSVDWFQKVTVGSSTSTSYLDTQYHTYCTTSQTLPKVTDVLGYGGGGGGTTSGGTGTGSTYEEALPCEGEYTGRDGTCRTTAWNIAALRKPKVIVNNLTTPCLLNTLEFMRAQVFELHVQRILIEFNRSLDNTYTFSQFIGHPSEDGREFRDGTYSFQIELNSTALANASREYVAATIYHEILHTYLTVEGGVARDLNHQEMARRFIIPMADALRRLFPGSLTQADAEALAWGGLGETAAWQTLVRNDVTNGTTVTANIILTNNRYKNLNNSYRNAYGTLCN